MMISGAEVDTIVFSLGDNCHKAIFHSTGLRLDSNIRELDGSSSDKALEAAPTSLGSRLSLARRWSILLVCPNLEAVAVGRGRLEHGLDPGLLARLGREHEARDERHVRAAAGWV